MTQILASSVSQPNVQLHPRQELSKERCAVRACYKAGRSGRPPGGSDDFTGI